MHEQLPVKGCFETIGRVANVWDKGHAAVFDVEVGCEYFTATYSIFAPGAGGFGGERGASWSAAPAADLIRHRAVPTFGEQAALHRLTGDRHLIHIDPAAARAIGAPRPILHGLCTLAASVRGVADVLGAHPADLVELRARFAAPVLPGQDLKVRAGDSGDFAVSVDGSDVVTGGLARFG